MQFLICLDQKSADQQLPETHLVKVKLYLSLRGNLFVTAA